jgi:hypothetical protein
MPKLRPMPDQLIDWDWSITLGGLHFQPWSYVPNYAVCTLATLTGEFSHKHSNFPALLKITPSTHRGLN